MLIIVFAWFAVAELGMDYRSNLSVWFIDCQETGNSGLHEVEY